MGHEHLVPRLVGFDYRFAFAPLRLELFLRPTRDLEVSLGHRSHDAYRWP